MESRTGMDVTLHIQIISHLFLCAKLQYQWYLKDQNIRSEKKENYYYLEVTLRTSNL